MLLTKRELPVLFVSLIYVPFFTWIALGRANYEFLLYVAVILVVGAWILWKQRRIKFGLPILWGLSAWGIMHMAGGNVRVGDGVLYDVILVPLIAEYHILRYDQVVHMLGFGIATLLCHHLLRPFLRDGIERIGTLLFLVVLMGSGFGAINEIIEFIAVVAMPETGVGGYTNTLLDLVFNLIGGLVAAGWLARREAFRPPVTHDDGMRG